MSPELEKLFHELADQSPRQRRDYYRSRSIDQSLQDEIETLLSFDAGNADDSRSDDTIRNLVNRAIAGVDAVDPPPTRFGPYQLVSLLGQGGMGSVYRAERVDGEVRQHVAIKTLRPGFGRPALTTHFLRERQLLAQLNHPSNRPHARCRPHSGALVLDANILIRAVLGQQVRAILEAHADDISFFVPESAYAEAEEHLAALVLKRGGDPAYGLASLRSMAALGTIVGQISAATSKPKRGSASARAIPKTGSSSRPRSHSTVRSGLKIPPSSAAASPRGRPPASTASPHPR